MKAIIVVPTIREAQIQRFLVEWEEEFAPHTVVVIEDNPEKTFRLRQANVVHYSWSDIDHELGEKSWIIPRRTDCVRSFGFYKAFKEAPDLVVSLDDDCYPVEAGFVERHFERLMAPAVSEAWVSTVEGVQPRGMPYYQVQRENECVLNHGLWETTPDLDAVSQLGMQRFARQCSPKDQVVGRGVYFPMCGMNLAFKPKIIPALYFLLMGQEHPFDRFGDIWAGIMLKRVCDHIGYGIRSGAPAVNHIRASNVWANLRKEVSGLEVNESFWQAVDSVRLTEGTIKECYLELAEKLEVSGEYWQKLRRAQKEWVGLFRD